jgi:hypothetical protein
MGVYDVHEPKRKFRIMPQLVLVGFLERKVGLHVGCIGLAGETYGYRL